MKSKIISQDYAKLFKLSQEAKVLEGVITLLGWDAETYMPVGAADIRTTQRELLAGLVHDRRTSKKYRDALGRLVDLKSGKVIGEGLSNKQKAALREWHRDFRMATALPTAFVKEFMKVTSDSLHPWRNARENNDFKSFIPSLERILDLNRKKAELLGYREHPYDALLDAYEPCMTTKEVAKLFGTLKPAITSLLQRIKKAKQVNDQILQGTYTHAQQMELADKLLHAIGYDMDRGRLDLSAHPFSNATHPTDSRITTRLDPNNPLGSLLAVLHEAGHGFYEQGLPTDEYGSPLGEAISLGIHESQSRFWETRIGLSQPFWSFCLPLLQEVLAPKFRDVSDIQLFRAVNKVVPSLVRVEADEVTYTLHIILRFEIELALMEGSLKVKDLPEAWNAKMTELLGVTPKNDAEGCLQDIHWSMGAFGYFPTYALGNVYAGMLFEAFEKSFPTWSQKIKKGEFAFTREWLTEQVHQHGRYYSGPDLIKKICGKKMSAEPYIDYLNKKYKKVYRLTKKT